MREAFENEYREVMGFLKNKLLFSKLLSEDEASMVPTIISLLEAQQKRIDELERIKTLAFELNEAIICKAGGSPEATTKCHEARMVLQQALGEEA